MFQGTACRFLGTCHFGFTLSNGFPFASFLLAGGSIVVVVVAVVVVVSSTVVIGSSWGHGESREGKRIDVCFFLLENCVLKVRMGGALLCKLF